jgi:hypothetical protein
VSVWESIKRLWTRHELELAENELEREALGVDISPVADKAPIPEATGLGPFPHDVVRPVFPEDESERPRP